MAIKDVDFVAEIQKIDAKISREQERKKRLLEKQRIRDEKRRLALGIMVEEVLGEGIPVEDLKIILKEWAGTTADEREEEARVGEYDKPEHHFDVSGN